MKESGSDPRLNGALYAGRGDLIFVTINYRLGGFGYLLNDRDPAAANLGLLDQIATLRWVRENTVGFGDDPENSFSQKRQIRLDALTSREQLCPRAVHHVRRWDPLPPSTKRFRTSNSSSRNRKLLGR